MISESIKEFVESVGHAFVASADASGCPHLAVGRGVKVPDPHHLVFEAWFCHTTLRNLARNPRVAVAVADPATGEGYQFSGRMVQRDETAMMDGYAPDVELRGMPQVQSRLHLSVEAVMAFSAGAHTDRPLG